MANTAFRKPTIGGDDNAWAAYNDAFIKSAVGEYTAYLYDDAGTLKISPGRIGINNGVNYYSCIIDTATTIDIAGVTSSRWAQIEMSESGGAPVFTATTIAAGTVSDTLPTAFTSAWDTTKAGYYISASKRCIGLIWKSAAGTLFGIINVKNMTKGYSGYNYLNAGKTGIIRWNKDIDVANIKVEIQIGVWNMDSTNTINLTHNISDISKIYNPTAMILNDSSSEINPLNYTADVADPSLVAGGVAIIVAASITMTRRTGGAFDNTNFNDAVMNRGYVYLELKE